MPSGKNPVGPTVECNSDGPYLVRGLRDLHNSRGDKLATGPVTALCRCGGSANKPFCDGTHAKIGFSGRRVVDGTDDHRDDYVGKEITIHDNRATCSHAGFCTEGLPSVFREDDDPWIAADGAKAAEVMAAVRKCPSGALRYTFKGVEGGDQERSPAIIVTKDGPYALIGGIVVMKQVPMQGASSEHCTLCRCGKSKNKPYCDGTHWEVDFKDDKN